jgi:hypothetical protein
MPRFLAFLLLIVAFPVWAVDEASDPALIPLPEQPDIPAPVESGQPMEPDVTIIRRGKDTVEEYRINNKLYMVKIQPSIGPAYYLIDTDGDGELESRRSDLDKGLNVPQWVLLRW